MKGLFIACLFVVGMGVGLYADSVEDTQFLQYVETTKNSKDNPPGMTVAADAKYRIIYAAMPISINGSDVTPKVIESMKQEMVKGFRSDEEMKADLKIIKDLKISFVWTFITTDKSIFSISISYKDI